MFIRSHFAYQIWEFRESLERKSEDLCEEKEVVVFFAVWVSNELVMDVNG